MSVIVYQFQTVKFIQMMSLTFGLFTQVSGSGPLGPLVFCLKFILKIQRSTLKTGSAVACISAQADLSFRKKS